MKIKNLKVGDVVYIREDVNKPEKIWVNRYDEPRLAGVQQIFKVIREDKCFEIVGDLDRTWVNRNTYTVEMIDWEKTSNLKVNEGCESIKKEAREDGTFKKITQSGESGNEITKAIGYDGKEVMIKNNNEKNDIEKTVMLLMLKSLGTTYGDVKREVEKVKIKWEPRQGERYFWINKYLGINWYIWDGYSVDKKLFESGNCFETRMKTREKLEKIKEILKGDYDEK